MALATDRRWRENVGAFTDFFNNSVEWTVQLYSTTTEFPVDDYLRRRERRLDDDDVSGSSVFRRLIEEWLDWYPRELEARGTNIREHYVIVPVRRDEIRGADDDAGVLDSLADLPVIGGVFGALASDDDMSEEEIRSRALDELNERLRMVKNEGYRTSTDAAPTVSSPAVSSGYSPSSGRENPPTSPKPKVPSGATQSSQVSPTLTATPTTEKKGKTVIPKTKQATNPAKKPTRMTTEAALS